MTTTLPEITTDLTIIEDLDFDAELPCESVRHPEGIWGHAGPGELFIIQRTVCGCYRQKKILMCRGIWEYAFASGVHCSKCKQHWSRDEVWTLVGTVR